jgi:hypothetical protein
MGAKPEPTWRATPSLRIRSTHIAKAPRQRTARGVRQPREPLRRLATATRNLSPAPPANPSPRAPGRARHVYTPTPRTLPANVDHPRQVAPASLRHDGLREQHRSRTHQAGPRSPRKTRGRSPAHPPNTASPRRRYVQRKTTHAREERSRDLHPQPDHTPHATPTRNLEQPPAARQQTTPAPKQPTKDRSARHFRTREASKSPVVAGDSGWEHGWKVARGVGCVVVEWPLVSV